MELAKIISHLPRYIAAGVALEIRGRSGIGKTDMVRQFVWEMNRTSGQTWGIGSHFFATYTPSDVTGYLMPRTVKIVLADGTVQEQVISEWSCPAYFRADPGQKFQWLNEFDHAVLVLEEFDKANPEVKKAAAPVILYGGIGNWYLKPGTARILLTNHADDGRQGSTKEFDFIINRKYVVHATQTVSQWLDWADKNGVHPMFKSFAEAHPGVVFSGEIPKVQGPYMTPRSFTMFNNMCANGLLDGNGHITDSEAFLEEGAGTVGGPATRDILTYFKFKDDVPDWDEIVKSPSRAKVPDNAGAQLMASHLCAYNVDDKTIGPAIDYIKRIRKEFYVTFAKAATKRPGMFRLVNSKPFEKWTAEHPELVALINAVGGAR